MNQREEQRGSSLPTKRLQPSPILAALASVPAPPTRSAKDEPLLREYEQHGSRLPPPEVRHRGDLVGLEPAPAAGSEESGMLVAVGRVREVEGRYRAAWCPRVFRFRGVIWRRFPAAIKTDRKSGDPVRGRGLQHR